MAVVLSGGMDEEKKRKRRNLIILVIAALLLLLMCGAGIRAYLYYQDYKDAEDEYGGLAHLYTRVDPAMAGPGKLPDAPEGGIGDPADEWTDWRVLGTAGVDFPDLSVDHVSLYGINADYMGWILIDDEMADIHISYPFLQGETNETYLRTTMEGEKNSAGCIFVDCNTPADFSDHHTILYGHNMADKSMFAALQKFRNTSEEDPERYFWLYLRDGSVLKCRLFSTHVVHKTSTIFQIDMSDNLYKGFFERILGESEEDWGYGEFDPEDFPEKTVTLATCHGQAGTSRRMAVHAYIDTWFVDVGAVPVDDEVLEEEGTGDGDAASEDDAADAE